MSFLNILVGVFQCSLIVLVPTLFLLPFYMRVPVPKTSGQRLLALAAGLLILALVCWPAGQLALFVLNAVAHANGTPEALESFSSESPTSGMSAWIVGTALSSVAGLLVEYRLLKAGKPSDVSSTNV